MSSYWIESVKNIKKEYKRLNNNIKTDICIIGGGITGLSAGYELAKEKMNVIILEKDKIGEKTTGNTTGKITSQHGLFYKYLIESKGIEFAKKYLMANEEAIKNIKEIILKENIECDFKNQDSYVYTKKEEKIEKIKEEIEALKTIGFDSEFISKNELPFKALAAIKFKNQAQFNIMKYLIGLANYIENNNGKIFEKTKVYDLKKENDKYLVFFEDGIVECQNVIIATHYPIFNSPGFYFLKMYQSMSYAIALETNNDIPEGIYISSDNPKISIRTIDVNKKNKMIVIVGNDHKTGESNNGDNYKELEKIAKSVYPDCKITYRWSTEDCITLDKIPYIGEFSKFMPNVYVATGYNKWGITTSNIAANIIKDKILKKDNKYENLFKATRMEPIKNIKEVENILKETASSLILKKMTIPYNKINDINKEEGKIVEIEGKKVGIYKDEKGNLHAVNPICSHLGCEVIWNSSDKTWDCPCHGSRFDYSGKSIYSPSIKDIENLKINN